MCTNQACSCLCSLWVVATCDTVSGSLIMPAHGFAGGKPSVTDNIPSCWLNLFMALQKVSHYYIYLYDDFSLADQAYVCFSESKCCCPCHCFKPANQAYPWCCRQWVAVVSDSISSLLTNPTLDSAVGELLLFCAPFSACWSSLHWLVGCEPLFSLIPFQPFWIRPLSTFKDGKCLHSLYVFYISR